MWSTLVNKVHLFVRKSPVVIVKVSPGISYFPTFVSKLGCLASSCIQQVWGIRLYYAFGRTLSLSN